MTIQEAYKQLLFQLFELYDDREAANIADMVIEHVTCQPKIERILNKEIPICNNELTLLNNLTQELLQQKPIQYILQEAWFADMKFFVNEHVLIPRPETEELVELVITEKANAKSIIDIGTGSGCIAIALKKKLLNASITSIDISKKAIEIAQQNATSLNANIDLQCLDFLNENTWNALGKYDTIVSNPPYIKQQESKSMSKHVLAYEPHLALFVADEDALIFYTKIAAFGKNHLNANGKIFVEINEKLGKETLALFELYGYKATLKKDMQGKDRMIIATL